MSKFFGSASGQFRIAPLGNPFEGAKSLLSYRQVSIPFWVNLLMGLFGLTIVTVIAILEIVSLGQAGFKMSGFGTTLAPKYPKDSQAYALFALEIPLFAMAALALVAAFVGRAVFHDAWIQWIYAGVQVILFVLGTIGFGFALAMSAGRLNSCLNKDKGSPYCHNEKNHLIATIVMSVLLWLNAFPILVIALLGLVWRNLQLMAIGMDADARREVTQTKDVAAQQKKIKQWSQTKTVQESTPAALENDSLLSSNSSLYAGEGAGKPSSTHKAVARAMVNNKFQ